jgi:hypothetical protein
MATQRLDPDPPDLATQLESLLDAVWQCEKEWRLDDHIALAVRNQLASDRAQPRRPPRDR